MPQIIKIIRRCVALLTSGRWDELGYKVWIRMHSLDLVFASNEALGLSPNRSNWYSDSGGPDLAKILRRLNLPRGGAIDLGCGKGGAVFTLCRFPFYEVLGVDISKDLVRVAEWNRNKLGLKNVRFICADAALFTEYDSIEFVYMYNPFPAPVMKAAIRNLCESIARVDRRVMILYKRPYCHDIVVDGGVFKAIADEPVGPGLSNLFRVYMHAPDRALSTPSLDACFGVRGSARKIARGYIRRLIIP
jgi:hypothetical protein